MESRKPEVKAPTPEVEPALLSGGQGAGAAGSPAAGGAPTRVCKEFEYRRNLRMPGRTQYYLIDTGEWEIVKPTRAERSKTRAHGKDVYCLSKEVWSRVVVVCLRRSNSGKLEFWAGSDSETLRNTVAREIEELLAMCGEFEEMEETVKKYVEAKRLASIVGRGG